MSEQKGFGFPTQTLDLPSKGLVYPETSPLSTGKVELKVPSAKEEDILTNSAFIQQGIVIDKLLESVVVSKVDLDELIEGDKNAILIATRILAFGSDYSFMYDGEEVTVNLSELKEKNPDETMFQKGVNEFEFQLPLTKHVVTFKLLTGKDEKKIDAEIKGMKKINKQYSGDITTRLKHTIVALNGNRDQKTIREFVDVMPIRDSKALRKYTTDISPNIEMKFDFTRKNGEVVEGMDVPIGVNFFWPE